MSFRHLYCYHNADEVVFLQQFIAFVKTAASPAETTTPAASPPTSPSTPPSTPPLPSAAAPAGSTSPKLYAVVTIHYNLYDRYGCFLEETSSFHTSPATLTEPREKWFFHNILFPTREYMYRYDRGSILNMSFHWT